MHPMVVVPGRTPVRGLAAGFTLVEMALVLGLIGLLAYLFLPLSNTLREEQQRREARAKLEAIDAALIRYVMLNDRLPCPADGALLPSDPNYGVAREDNTQSTGCTNGVINRGIVPWRTLGLPTDAAIDPWGSWVTYRPYILGISSLTRLQTSPGGNCGGVSPPFLKNKPATPPPSPENWVNFLDNCKVGARPVGWSIDLTTTAQSCTERVADPASRTGAAYVLISHGANRCGGYTPNGIYINVCTGTAGMGPAEQSNRNNNAPLTGNPDTSGQCYKDGLYQEKGSAQPFDDVVLWRPVMQVAVQAKKVQ